MGGKPYITHPLEVARILEKKGFGWQYIQTALFHDLLEDTDATIDELSQLAEEPVVNAVLLLTKTTGYTMETYTYRISQYELAKIVKLADRLHNLLSAIDAKVKFRRKYIEETEQYYLDLAESTVFEEDIKTALQALKDSVELPNDKK